MYNESNSPQSLLKQNDERKAFEFKQTHKHSETTSLRSRDERICLSVDLLRTQRAEFQGTCVDSLYALKDQRCLGLDWCQLIWKNQQQKSIFQPDAWRTQDQHVSARDRTFATGTYAHLQPKFMDLVHHVRPDVKVRQGEHITSFLGGTQETSTLTIRWETFPDRLEAFRLKLSTDSASNHQ